MGEKHVIVRSSQSGVWYGLLVASEGTPDGLERVTLADARRIWHWSGAGSCSGLAAHGPREAKMPPPVMARISGCCEVLDCAPLVMARRSTA